MMESYVAVDLETTGIGARREKITEIGMVKVVNNEPADTFHTLINPGRPIPERIAELTGISDEIVRDAPFISEVLDGALRFCDGFALLGHNLIFDYGFLVQAAVNQRLPFQKDGVDTLKLCRLFLPADAKKNLGAACAWFDIAPETAHRALSDARSAHFLYQKLKERYGAENRARFEPAALNYRAKRERTATKRQKDYLQDLIKYHRIDLSVSIDNLSGNEISRITDRIIFRYGRIPKVRDVSGEIQNMQRGE